jgi:MinD superfamily P-loop ATPase
MKELVILSGKGGTGKTTIMAAFASLAENKILCDADVDAADLHLIVAPDILRRMDFYSGFTARIDPDRCSACGLCRDLCRWEAIDENFKVNPIDCEGCGVCVHFCPEDAIDFPENLCGQWFVSETRFGPMVHARLGIAEENSGKLVSYVRSEARLLGQDRKLNLILTDGPPGIGCPVIASLGSATAALIVVEPTISGIHDMQRVVDLAHHFKVPVMLCVNKFDLNLELTQTIEKSAAQEGITCLGRIPYDSVFTKAMVNAQTIFEYNPNSEAAISIRKMWNTIEKKLENGERINAKNKLEEEHHNENCYTIG